MLCKVKQCPNIFLSLIPLFDESLKGRKFESYLNMCNWAKCYPWKAVSLTSSITKTLRSTHFGILILMALKTLWF